MYHNWSCQQSIHSTCKQHMSQLLCLSNMNTAIASNVCHNCFACQESTYSICKQHVSQLLCLPNINTQHMCHNRFACQTSTHSPRKDITSQLVGLPRHQQRALVGLCQRLRPHKIGVLLRKSPSFATTLCFRPDVAAHAHCQQERCTQV